MRITALKNSVLAVVALGLGVQAPALRADNRVGVQDVDQWPHIDPARQATALVVDRQAFYKDRETGATGLYTRTLNDRYGLCKDQKFRQEPSIVGACTAFLTANDEVMTSPACMLGPADCDSKLIVFGADRPGFDFSDIKAADVYSCTYIDGSVNNNVFGAHRKVILDRAVEGRSPLPLAREDVQVGDDVVLISHPHGLAQKYSAATVWETDLDHNRFRAGFAALRGSVGGPILSRETGEVVGLLHSSLNNGIRENEYRGCAEYDICSADGCFLEISTAVKLFRDGG